MTSPDITPYLDLRIFDQSPTDIFNAAVTELQTNLPAWIPREGNTEVLLLEAMALENSEAIFAVNRLPSGIVQVLLQLFGITQNFGNAPIANLQFNMVDTAGYTVPANTRVRMTLPGGLTPIIFTTNVNLVIAPGSSNGIVAATGDRFTADGNGVAPGTLLTLIDSIIAIDTVQLSAFTTSGTDPESSTAYFSRALERFARLSDALVVPSDFTAYALEQTYVNRATVIDNWTPDTIPTPVISSVTNSNSGGTLTAGTYTYRVAAINAQGTTLASAEVGTTISSGTTNKATVTWTAPTVPSGVSPITNYKIYGRTAGAELLMATVSSGTLTWDDTGSVTPSGALPAANTTTQVVGSAPGHETVAVYGNGSTVASGDKTTLLNAMEGLAVGNLAVHIIDPTITTQAVTATVKAKANTVSATVQAACVAAVQAYLNPASWPWAGTIRVNELISLLDQVTGVDYVVSIATPAADVVLTGVANLVNAGTVTITVT